MSRSLHYQWKSLTGEARFAGVTYPGSCVSDGVLVWLRFDFVGQVGVSTELTVSDAWVVRGDGTSPSEAAVTSGVATVGPRGVDEEGNGLPDIWEWRYWGEPGQAWQEDHDQDGLSTRDEWLSGTSPLLADTDGDGLPDLWEILHGMDPCTAGGEHGGAGDPDLDGQSNLEECLGGSNPADGASISQYPEWGTALWVRRQTALAGSSDETRVLLSFGVRQGACDGVDSGLDHPIPEGHDGIGFAISGREGSALLKDDFRGISTEARWRLSVEVPAYQDVTLMLAGPAPPAEACVVWSYADEQWQACSWWQPVPAQGWHFSDSAGRRVQVRILLESCAVQALPFAVCIGAYRWHLLSFPMAPCPDCAREVLPGLLGAWTWNAELQALEPVTCFGPRKGYWVFLGEPFEGALSGLRVSDPMTMLREGWNLVGAVGDPSRGRDAYALPRRGWCWDPSRGAFCPSGICPWGRGAWVWWGELPGPLWGEDIR